jgi:transketolase
MNIQEKAINTIRILSVDQINKAKSGHPGIALGAAPMIFTLYTGIMKVAPKNVDWFNRDRFILSAGHGSSMLYSVLHLSGFDLSIDDLKQFRQLNSKTPGHPEYGHVPGVEVTTGPLGQGISMAVGMAITESFLAAKYNVEGFDVVDHYTYALCGDGDLQEGVAQEAMSLAGRLKLGKLILLYDSNDIQLDGKVSMTNSENVKAKYESMNWQYIRVNDGNDIDAIKKAIKKAQKETTKPTIIEVKTIIGYMSPLAGLSDVHGAPLGEEKTKVLRTNLEYKAEPFEVDDDVYEYFRKHVYTKGERARLKWNRLMKEYKVAHPELYHELTNAIEGKVDIDYNSIPLYPVGKKEATRNTSGKVIDLLSKQVPTLIGGSADLTKSTKAKGSDGNYDYDNRTGRNINFGVREHAMGAIVNGMTVHGGVKAFSGAFFVFSDYMKPALRMASIMNVPSIFVFSHDTVAVGEDGPTHEPIEQLTGLRTIPNMNVIRPCDANETIFAWRVALESTTTPTSIILTRQDLPTLENTSYEGVRRGGYIISKEKGRMDGIIIAAGSEVELAIKAQAELEKENIHVRVVSMPSTNLFDKQSKTYRNTILPEKMTKRLAIEMGATSGWYKYASTVYGIDTFGISGQLEDVIKYFGFTVENIVKIYKEIK